MKYLLLCVSCVLCPVFILAGGYGDFAVDSDTVALWYFEGNATDETTNNNDGTVTGATSTQFGRFGQAYSYDGSNDYIEVGDSTSLDMTSNITIETWIRPATSTTDQYIVAKRDGTERQWALYLPIAGKLQFWTWGANTNIGTSTTLSVDTWYYIAVTFGTASGAIYINGVDVTTDTTASAITSATSNIFIGARGDGAGGGSYEFKGIIGSVRISNVVRSAQEVRDYYRQSQGGYGIIH